MITKPSTISQCMLNAAAMMEVDADYYQTPPDKLEHLTREKRKSIAACNRGQAKLLRKSAEIADRALVALLDAQRIVNARFAFGKPEDAPITVEAVNAINHAVHELKQ